MRLFVWSVLLVALAIPAYAQTPKTQSALQTEITTNWPDNTVGAITPAILRATVADIVASYTQSAVACPTSLSTYQAFANTSAAPTGVTLGFYDGAQCVNWATFNTTAHSLTWAGAIIPVALGGTGANNASSTGVAQWASGTYSVSAALANGTTATTQSPGDTSTKIATNAFVSTIFAAPPALGSVTPAAVSATTLVASGNATMPGLLTTGTIDGSICQDASGHLIFNSGANCYSSGSASAGGSNTNVQYNSSGSLAGASTFVYSGGKLGIGTASPSQTLSVVGNGFFQAGSGSTTVGLEDGSSTNSWQLTAATSGLFSLHDATNSLTPFSVAANTPSNTLVVASTGSVGIGKASPGFPLDVAAEAEFGVNKGYADIREWGATKPVCNPSSPTTTDVAAAVWAAYNNSPSYTHFFIPAGCVWDYGQNASVSSNAWTNNTWPNSVTVLGEDWTTSGIQSSPSATFTGTLSSCSGSNPNQSCTLTVSGVTGTICTVSANGTCGFYGGTSSAGVVGTIASGSGPYSVTGVNINTGGSSIGPISMGSRPSITVGTNDHMDNAFYASADCSEINTLFFGGSTSGYPTQCSLRHFSTNGSFIGTMGGYAFEPWVANCAAATVPGITGVVNDVPCMADNQESPNGDAFFIQHLGTAGGVDMLNLNVNAASSNITALSINTAASYNGYFADWLNHGTQEFYVNAGGSVGANGSLTVGSSITAGVGGIAVNTPDTSGSANAFYANFTATSNSTGFLVNSASGYTGYFANFNNGGTQKFYVNSGGGVGLAGTLGEIGGGQLSIANGIDVSSGNNTMAGTLTVNGGLIIAPSFQTAVGGGYICYGSGSFSGYFSTDTSCGSSAKRLKDEVKKISGDHLAALHPVVYTWKDKKEYDAKEHGGLYADDVATMDPRCGIYENGKIKSYDDRCVIAYLVAAVKSQGEEIAALRREMKR